MGNALSPANLPVAMERIRAWRFDPDMVVSCPECSAPGLEISDRSSRPHTEWYHVHCAACGLDHSISIPMAPPQF